MRAAVGDGNWLLQCLAVSMRTESISILDLHGLGIDGRGVRDFARHAGRFPALKALGLKYNSLGFFHGDVFLVKFIENSKATSKQFAFLDVSCNGLSFAAIRSISDACQTRAGRVRLHVQPAEDMKIDFFASGYFHDHSSLSEKKSEAGLMDVVIEGNFPAEEIWNSALHGFGVLFAVWGFWDLMHLEYLAYPLRLAIVVYGLSAILLFTASTLYHSFFSFTLTKQIFQIADHCSVFVLIAGSYTPICAHLAVVRDIPTAWSVLKAEWAMCVIGILLHTLSLHWPKWARSLEYMTVELCIYVAMGWLVVVMWEPVAMFLDPGARYLLIVGGVLYMIGVAFFVWDSVKIVPALHAVWHFFVLAAAVTHFFAIRNLVSSLL
jgi:hemolysin III